MKKLLTFLFVLTSFFATAQTTNSYTNYAALTAVTPPTGTNPTAFTQGYYFAGDGGGGQYFWTGSAWKLVEGDVIKVLQYGVKADGMADDAAAINAALLAAANKTLDWQNVTCRINSQLNITKPIKATAGMAWIKRYGAGIGILVKTTDGDSTLGGANPAFTKGFYPNFTFPVLTREDNPSPSLMDGSAGIQFENVQNWIATIPYVSGFETSIKLLGSNLAPNKGSAYNTFYLGRLQGSVNVLLAATNANGYVNSNHFYNGSFGSRDSTVDSASTHIKFVGFNNVFQCNENTFYSPALEGYHRIGIDFNQYCRWNRVLDGRVEMPRRQFYYRFGPNTSENKIIDCYDFNVNMGSGGIGGAAFFQDLGSYNLVHGTTQKVGLYTYYDGEWLYEKFNKTLDTSGVPSNNRQIFAETAEKVISIDSTTTFPVDVSMKFGNKFRISTSADLPLNAIRLIHTPDSAHDYNVEIVLLQAQSKTGVKINSQWLTTLKNDQLRYGKVPLPYQRPNGKDRYVIRKSFQNVLSGLVIQDWSSDNYNLQAGVGILANNVTSQDSAPIATTGITNAYLNAKYPLDAYPLNSTVIFTTLTDATQSIAECRRITTISWSYVLTSKL